MQLVPRRCPKCGGVLRRDRYACEAYDGCIQCGFVSFLEKAQPRTDQSGTVVLQDITEEEGNENDTHSWPGMSPAHPEGVKPRYSELRRKGCRTGP